ncbi:hypothetical protein JIQ42_02881 [Leishmania sp. Namibia]|uniref:hypothetical protein n=1 Tax=Leishmania sp. Namibia TaxID=2802991 RepID=UPI001B7438FA|nr:hypothetical protein JIQ42_02881 [Leishmania sp. Namibia]
MYPHSLFSRSPSSLFSLPTGSLCLRSRTLYPRCPTETALEQVKANSLSLVDPRSRSQPQCIVDSFTMASDPVDIKLDLEKECLATECAKKVEAYNACLERIKSVDPMKEPHCYNQYFDIIHCVDVCVDPKLWPTLK